MLIWKRWNIGRMSKQKFFAILKQHKISLALKQINSYISWTSNWKMVNHFNLWNIDTFCQTYSRCKTIVSGQRVMTDCIIQQKNCHCPTMSLWHSSGPTEAKICDPTRLTPPMRPAQMTDTINHCRTPIRHTPLLHHLYQCIHRQNTGENIWQLYTQCCRTL